MHHTNLDLKRIQTLIPKRKNYAHKGDFGKVIIFAGSRRYPGASYLCTQAAVRSGSGLVTLISDYEILDILSIKLHEAMIIHNGSQEIPKLIQEADSIAIGCGMGNNMNTLKAVEYVLTIADQIPVVIDADGINVLAGHLDMIRGKSNVLLTPHQGEFSRLIGVHYDIVAKNREHLAIEFVEEYGVNLLLKGKNTIIVRKNELTINPTGSSKMSSGGMGDALTGMIASFAGQGLDVYEAGCLAAFVHGYSADEKGKSMYSVIASDVIEHIPYALNQIFQYKN